MAQKHLMCLILTGFCIVLFLNQTLVGRLLRKFQLQFEYQFPEQRNQYSLGPEEHEDTRKHGKMLETTGEKDSVGNGTKKDEFPSQSRSSHLVDALQEPKNFHMAPSTPSGRTGRDAHQEWHHPSSCYVQDITFRHEDDVGSLQRVGQYAHFYSAYYDARDLVKEPVVRVIGLAKINTTVYCHLWSGTNSHDTVDVVQGEMVIPIGKKGATLETVFILCPVNQSNPVPTWVVMSERHCGPPDATLIVSNIHARDKKYNFTVCLHKALMEHYNNAAQLVEWVEVNRLMGAEFFVLYNFSSNLELLPFINYYVHEGIMEYRKWPLNHVEMLIENWKSQNGVMFDCTYRFMYSTKYLVMTDIDEIVVPRKHETWWDFLHDNPCPVNTSAFNVPQIMISLLFPMNEQYAHNKTVSGLQINTMLHNLRQNFTWPCGIRSKLIIKPDMLVNPGCHLSLTTKKDECCVDEQWAQLFHYRWWNETIWEKWVSKSYFQSKPYFKYYDLHIEENRMYHWANRIIENIAKVHKAVTGFSP